MEQQYTAGNVYELNVERETSFGYFLKAGTEDILLHKREAEGEVNEGDDVTVFLYHDHQGRLAATMSMPFLTLDTFARVNVVEVKPRLGVFVNIGIQKDVLLSKDDLPAIKKRWPEEGDQLFCGLKLDKKYRLFADLVSEEEMASLAEPAANDSINQEVKGTVYRIIDQGAFVLTDDQLLGFIHNDEMKTAVRLGERVTGRVTFVREDGRVNLSLKPILKEAYNQDSEMLLHYLTERGGAIPFSDKSEPDKIKNEFHISKAAFKRAMGKLLKENKVYQEGGWTYLTVKPGPK
ncbi:CvfB family protein [Pseudalkalibacillus caeni]|uniref:CvfB family protein n=1 Tax=Exobacillus caeni TaxID=2574798 RepID=UPI001FE2880B|nr:S1-like domain-containing RNA-binding protein [Pseudalkalibacillus caeni]